MTETKNTTDQDRSETSDAVDKRVQKVVDKENEQGYRGVKVDPTPDSHYSLEGVVDNKPTPETHPEQAAKVGSTKFTATPGAATPADKEAD